jgi:enamine deaminase RidA (YjgF/YER057c/UK114 family)
LTGQALQLIMLRWLFGWLDWPVTWVEGANCGRGPICGMQSLAVSGAEVETVYSKNNVVGNVFEDGNARYCFLGGILPRDIQASRGHQAGQAYEQLEIALAQIGMDLSHLVRTWFFLDDITAWYREFNEVRNEVYIQRRLLDGLVPASTGIGGRNPAAAALTVAACALQPKHGAVRAEAVSSPLQCPAPTYGSCFSRAVEVTAPGSSQLMISGTASIEPGGRTAHVGELTGQIDLTFRVVAAILESRKMFFDDVTRAVAYFRRARDVPIFRAWWAEHGMSDLPVVATRADICRDDLLFEIELDAIVPTASG